MQIVAQVRRWLRRQPDPLADLIELARSAENPYTAEIARHKARGGNVFLNCTMSVAPGQKPIEFGPQCDDFQDGDEAIAQDKDWTYLSDGRRLRNRPPGPRR